MASLQAWMRLARLKSKGAIKVAKRVVTQDMGITNKYKAVAYPLGEPARHGLQATGYFVPASVGAVLGARSHINRQQSGPSGYPGYPGHPSMAKSMFKGAMYGAGTAAGLHSAGRILYGGAPLKQVLTPAAKGLLLTGLGLAA